MRSKIEANEDKDIKGLKEKNKDDVRQCQNGVGYFIAYDNLFSTWISKGKDFDVSDVRNALSAFNRNISNTHKKLFDKIFDTLQTGLSKLGTTSGSGSLLINIGKSVAKYINDDDKCKQVKKKCEKQIFCRQK